MTVDTGGHEGPGGHPVRWVVSRAGLTLAIVSLFFASNPDWIIDSDRTISVDTDYTDPVELNQKQLSYVAMALCAFGLGVFYLTRPKA